MEFERQRGKLPNWVRTGLAVPHDGQPPTPLDVTPASLFALTRAEWSWLLFLSAATALLFFTNKVLLFSEFNVWALVAYATDFIKSTSTQRYVLRLLNTPNGLLNFAYFYLRDVVPYVNSYTLYKTIMFSCVVANTYLVIRLSRFRPTYILLLPVAFGYILVGGMTNYYLALVLFFAALLLYESGANTRFNIFIITLLTYQAHFMGFCALLLLIFYHEGLRRTFLYSVIPLLLFASYKYQYHDDYHMHFSYYLTGHFLAIRRVLLPSITDVHSNLWILTLSAILNASFILYLAYLLFRRQFRLRGGSAWLMAAILALAYFATPSQLAGSGINIHERLIVPFVAFFIHLTEKTSLDRRPTILFTALIIGNIGLCHYFYGSEAHDYRMFLLNKETMGQAAQSAEGIIEGKPVDQIPGAFFTTSFVDKREGADRPK